MDQLDTPVRLVVKAPNQRIEDQTIDCALNWTIRKLKAYLTEVYPNNPKSEEQKLIYCGQLLLDHLKLKDVLRQYDKNDTHILHLVCSLTKDDVATAKDSSNVPRSTDEGLRQRRVETNAHTNPTPTITGNVTPAFPNYPMTSAFDYNGSQGLMLTPEQMSQQMLWMQQMYTQYMTHYMQYAQLQSTSFFQSSVTQQEAQQQPNAAPPPVAPAARPANENVRMNAQGGQVIDDDDEEFGRNRDWLDWFYISSRAFVLLSIVFVYSSLSRFIAVAILVVLFYLYQTDWFRMRQRPRREIPVENAVVVEENARNDDNNNRPHQDAVNADVQEQEVNEIQEIENVADNDMDHPMPQIELGPSMFSVTWTFISAFFSSLIPEQPDQIN